MLLAYVGNPRRLAALLKISTHGQIRFLSHSFPVIDKAFEQHSQLYVAMTVPSDIWTNCQLAI
ncbi:hypothetical protein ALC57_03172 [Trachymyrmex cornetzi]|uniref:Uncharacterized protein n=1 Tax=Trachymyrmex cornetzi TaxID=471704 RepID=A0A151JN39_9HYME|nr:hypothetical protein ALC57_03172 [Trachymyrmex cornetzi]